jgi:endonuclease YncB( thermonuclease family)
MRYRIALGALLVLFCTNRLLARELIIPARVVGVTGGDTIRVLNSSNQQLRIRLAWIDAPEKGQAFGSRAKSAMSDLVFGREVELHVQGTDRYGRLVCLVFFDGTDAGLELLKAGLAWAYEHYLPEAPADVQHSYRDAERTAREQRLGLWSDPNPQPPWEFRRARTVQAKEQHGNLSP